MTQKSADLVAKELLNLTNNDVEAAIREIRNAVVKKSKTRVPANSPVVVEVKEIKKSYKTGSTRVEALKGVDLQVKQGEFVALTGTSGSGKSTLLQLIGGLDKPSGGSVLIDGQDISKFSDRKLSQFRNKTIGFVFQFFYLQPFLTLATNVEVPAMFARIKPKNRHDRSTSTIDAVGLSDRITHLPRELSGGQLQRAAIARALMNKPKILLADEPTGNLDSKNAVAIFDMFEKIRTDYGTTVIVVTHDTSLASRADRIVQLSDGVLV